MQKFILDDRLKADTYPLLETDSYSVVLHKNAEVLWLIVVPHTVLTEFYQLDPDIQKSLCQQVNRLSEFIQTHFEIDKINVASIGNVVSQMHIHVIGRRKDDAYWPDVVWGNAFEKNHLPAEVESIRSKLLAYYERT
jgi:diadenosine tetraphosphate (Ap4A) HIT family hydrolase